MFLQQEDDGQPQVALATSALVQMATSGHSSGFLRDGRRRGHEHTLRRTHVTCLAIHEQLSFMRGNHRRHEYIAVKPDLGATRKLRIIQAFRIEGYFHVSILKIVIHKNFPSVAKI